MTARLRRRLERLTADPYRGLVLTYTVTTSAGTTGPYPLNP